MAAAAQVGTPPVARLCAPQAVLCTHCGLEIPAGRIDAAQPLQFCCDGCSSVYAILEAAGLGEYYTHQSFAEAECASPRQSRRKFEELDLATFQAAHCESRAPGLSSVDLFLEGVHCSACVWLVERLPRVAPAVVEERFDLTRSVLRVTWSVEDSRLSAVARALDSLGYCQHPTSSTTLAEEQRK